jgi:hypothetical protein
MRTPVALDRAGAFIRSESNDFLTPLPGQSRAICSVLSLLNHFAGREAIQTW